MWKNFKIFVTEFSLSPSSLFFFFFFSQGVSCSLLAPFSRFVFIFEAYRHSRKIEIRENIRALKTQKQKEISYSYR